MGAAPSEGSAEVVCTSDDVESAVFFPDVRLNYAENLLRPLPGVDDEAIALTSVHGDGRVESCPAPHCAPGYGRVPPRWPGTASVPVTGWSPSRPTQQGPVVTLALAALGAAVSTGMPDMGPTALLGRFTQVEPAVLVVDRTEDPAGRAPTATPWRPCSTSCPPCASCSCSTTSRHRIARRLRMPGSTPIPSAEDAPAEWPRFPFDHPLFVMFSSGTTGPPKAMVHGAGGTLLEHVKEHRLHVDLRPETSCTSTRPRRG